MPSERNRWKTGPLRNTVGHTSGATGAVTGGVEGHVKAEDREAGPQPFGGDAEGAKKHPPSGGKVTT